VIAGLAVNPSSEVGEGVKLGSREGIDLTTSFT